MRKVKDKIDKLKNQIGTNFFGNDLVEKYETDFKIRFAHHSTAIEGNTLSLVETKVILEDGISIGGKAIREIYEVINFAKTYDYIKSLIEENILLSEEILKNIHQMLMDNIIKGGIYRNHAVRITGSQVSPPEPTEMYYQMKSFFENLDYERKNRHPVSFAAYVHAEFVRIHPFSDGNGRTARILLNYILMEQGYRPILLEVKERLKYYECHEKYSVQRDLKDFDSFVQEKELQALEEYLDNTRQLQRKELDFELEP